MNGVLIAALLLPLAGAAALAGVRDDRTARLTALVTTGTVFVLVCILAAEFDRGDARRFQFTTDVVWARSLGLRFHLGIDGVSLPLLVLTALLCLLVAVHSLGKEAFPGPPTGGSSRAFLGLVLVLETGVLGTFAALDLVLFFLFFEVVLIPMYFLIARWGDPELRRAAAFRFILYTLLGSALMLLGFLVVQAHTGTFDIAALSRAHGSGLTHGTQLVAFLAIALGLAVKVPMWPLHTWLPDAHTAAPTAGSVLLAGVLLKMGTYGLVRIALPVLPDGAHTFAPYLAAFGVVGIVYGSYMCISLVRARDGDLKRIIAYSSVGHMGFALLGIATLTPQGVNGALFVNIGHGLVTGLLFFLVGAVKERRGTSLLDRIGGSLYARAPGLGGMLAFGAIAGLGLPGLAGFWGEWLAMYGAYEPGAGLKRSAYLVFLALAGLGTVLTSLYMLTVVRRVCAGPRASADLPDVTHVEAASWTPLVLLTVGLGVWPAAVLTVTDPAVHGLLGG